MAISQREARRLQKRVRQLEQEENVRRQRWGSVFPGGISITSAKYEQWDAVPVAIRTARRLGHAVIVLADDDGRVNFLALKLATE